MIELPEPKLELIELTARDVRAATLRLVACMLLAVILVCARAVGWALICSLAVLALVAVRCTS